MIVWDFPDHKDRKIDANRLITIIKASKNEHAPCWMAPLLKQEDIAGNCRFCYMFGIAGNCRFGHIY